MTGSSIDRYISQAKLNHPEQVNEEMYELLVGDIFQMVVKHCGLSTNLKFVFTPSRRAERLRLCGESWLIYDQYLGQTFNLLNRLFFNAEGEKEAITYFHKYIAERALEHGRAEFGVSLANIYADNRDRVRETVNGDPLRPAFTIVSEQFAIFHELSHEILDSGHDFAEFFMSLVADSIDARREVRRTQTRESLIDGFRTSDPAAYHDAPLDQVIAETLADYDSPMGVRGRQEYDRALDAPETAEELFCDFAACEFALIGGGENLMGLRDTLRALYVASYHLKTLDYVDRAVEAILLDQPGRDHEAHRLYRSQVMQVRNHCLRDHLLMMYEARLHDREERERAELVSTFKIDLMKDQRRYYEFILDPATKTVSFLSEPGRLHEMASEHEAALVKFAADVPQSDKADARNALASIVILKQTGWPITAVSRFADAIKG
ncbi:hypothetical protein O6027_03285 [Sphingomonas aerolata]|uniref:hypothetical protein n=1 Tax=Sphingomonas aerolata TaxID=185951 RepID=UPI00334B4DC1